MCENKICETIRALRHAKGLSQKDLADMLGVSMQAVSKWETGSALPDILTLPLIAETFGVSIDTLFYGAAGDAAEPPAAEAAAPNGSAPDLPAGIQDDGVLRIVQFWGATPLAAEEWKQDCPIKLDLRPFEDARYRDLKLPIEVWGSADIKGNVNGSVKAGDGVNCGDVNGSVKAGDGINCGDVNGSAHAGDGINCGDVNGSAHAGDNINCGNVNGSASAEGSIECRDINGSATAKEGDIHCDSIVNKGRGEIRVECETLRVKGKLVDCAVKCKQIVHESGASDDGE